VIENDNGSLKVPLEHENLVLGFCFWQVGVEYLPEALLHLKLGILPNGVG
jgi:hypothetical protein